MTEFIKKDYLENGEKIGFVQYIKGAKEPIFNDKFLIVKVANMHIKCETLTQAKQVISFSGMGEIVANYEDEREYLKIRKNKTTYTISKYKGDKLEWCENEVLLESVLKYGIKPERLPKERGTTKFYPLVNGELWENKED